jgi:hypothetical protein
MEVSGQLHAPTALPPGKDPGIHWTRGWVEPIADLDAVVKRKTPSHRRESNPRTPIIQPVAQRYTDWYIYIYKFTYYFLAYVGHRFWGTEGYMFAYPVWDLGDTLCV